MLLWKIARSSEKCDFWWRQVVVVVVVVILLAHIHATSLRAFQQSLVHGADDVVFSLMRTGMMCGWVMSLIKDTNVADTNGHQKLASFLVYMYVRTPCTILYRSVLE